MKRLRVGALVLGLGAFVVPNGALAQSVGAEGQEPDAPAPPAQSDVDQALDISEELIALRDSIEAVLVGQDTVRGPAREVLRSRVRGWIEESAALQRTLFGLLPDLDTDGEGVGERGVEGDEDDAREIIRSRIVEYTQWFRAAFRSQRERERTALDSLAVARTGAGPDEIALIDSESRLRRGQVDTLFIGEAELLNTSGTLGVDVADGWRDLEQAAVARADGLTGQLRLAQLDERRLRRELEDAERAGLSEEVTAQARHEIQVVERLIADLSATLVRTSEFLDARGYETAPYRQLVIEATGEVTGDILDKDVLLGLASSAFDDAVSWVRSRGPTALVRLFIVLFFIVVGRLSARLIWWVFHTLRIVRVPRLATQLISRTLGPVGTLAGLGVGLWVIGVDATTVLAGAGLAGVVLGFALQDSLANFVSGFLILLYRPFDQDHTIEAAGVVGTVRSMGLANTTLVTFDNRKLSIPNSKLWGAVIANRSSEPTRRAEALIRVGFDQDLSTVSEIVLGRLGEHDLVLEDPAPSVYVSGAGDSWMELTVWAWTENANWWTVTAALPAMLKAALEEHGIPVPLPIQRLIGDRALPTGSPERETS